MKRHIRLKLGFYLANTQKVLTELNHMHFNALGCKTATIIWKHGQINRSFHRTIYKQIHLCGFLYRYCTASEYSLLSGFLYLNQLPDKGDQNSDPHCLNRLTWYDAL